MKNLFLGLFMLLLLNGCALLQLPGQTMKTVETAVKTTGKVAEATGKVVVAGGQAVGKVAEATGKTVEAIAKTPGAGEVIVNKVAH